MQVRGNTRYVTANFEGFVNRAWDILLDRLLVPRSLDETRTCVCASIFFSSKKLSTPERKIREQSQQKRLIG